MFENEEMVCIMSGRRQKANPAIESGWDCIQLDDKFYYVSKEWREKSYKKRVLIFKMISSKPRPN